MKRALAAAGLTVVLAGTLGCTQEPSTAPEASRPSVCADMDVVATVWTAQAPADMLGDAEALAGFTSGLITTLDDALAGIAAVAPETIDTDTGLISAALGAYYAKARAYAAGDTESVPVLSDDDRAALGRVADWASGQCPGQRW